MVTHQRGVGLVTLKQLDEPRWSLITRYAPTSWSPRRHVHAGGDRRAGGQALRAGRGTGAHGHVSTSARLRLQLTLGERMSQRLTEKLPDLLQDVIDDLAARAEADLLYLPVIHAGYEALFDRHADAREVLLLGSSFADDHPVLKKESGPAARDRRGLPALGREFLPYGS